MEDMNFQSIGYGAFELEYTKSYEFSENVKYSTADFNKLYIRRVRLPEGKNNLIYLLTDTFESGLKLTGSDSLFVPQTYRKVFYPLISVGTFMSRRFRINNQRIKMERNKYIKDHSRLVPILAKEVPKTRENVIFIASDVYQVLKPICERVNINKVYTAFFRQLMDILDGMSPEKVTGENPADNNRVLIIDADSFRFKPNAPMAENKSNPLYLIYLAFLRNRNLSVLNVDIDMMICSKNQFIKFNPTKIDNKTWGIFRQALFRLMNTNLDDYTDALTGEEKGEIGETSNEKTLHAVVTNTTSTYTANVSGNIRAVVNNAVENKLRQKAATVVEKDREIRAAVPEKESDLDMFTKTLPVSNYSSINHANPAKNPLSAKQRALFKSVAGEYDALATDTGIEYDDDDDSDEYNEDEIEQISDDAEEILTTDEDVAETVLDEIQEVNTGSLKSKSAPVNSERDRKLREEQKKVIVGSETIEQILSRDEENVSIEEEDKSKVMHTSNENMKHIKFANFEKTYLDNLYTRDLVACFDMLKDKESPFYIVDVKINDTSTTLDYKDTWTVTLKDELGKRHTIKVDIPKFQNDRFMLINGTRFMILKQNFYNPLVKDTPDTVMLTTNYNKITIKRYATKSLSSIERIFTLIKRTGINDIFVHGDSSKPNMKYISCLEYDELSRRIFSFKAGNCTMYFSRDYLAEMESAPKTSDDEFFIGYEGKNPIIINEDTGLDRNGRSIIQIIEEHLPEEYKSVYDSIKSPKQSMYVQCKLAGQELPIISVLCVWNGLTKTLDKMGMMWHFVPGGKKSQLVPTMKSIKFKNGVLQYEPKMYAELILNGLSKMHPEQFQFEDFDSEAGYDEFIYSQFGSYNGITEIQTFNEFLVDPITKSICKQLMFPDDPSGLLIYAVKLLSDNAYNSKASDKSYRVRSIETIPAILYSALVSQYKAYVKRGRRTPMTLNQRCVIKQLLAEKTVEPYSVLNPVIEVSKTHTISTKGYKGSNSEHAYNNEEKRSYDPTSIGKLAMSTSPKWHWANKTS